MRETFGNKPGPVTRVFFKIELWIIHTSVFYELVTLWKFSKLARFLLVDLVNFLVNRSNLFCTIKTCDIFLTYQRWRGSFILHHGLLYEQGTVESKPFRGISFPYIAAETRKIIDILVAVSVWVLLYCSICKWFCMLLYSIFNRLCWNFDCNRFKYLTPLNGSSNSTLCSLLSLEDES